MRKFRSLSDGNFWPYTIVKTWNSRLLREWIFSQFFTTLKILNVYYVGLGIFVNCLFSMLDCFFTHYFYLQLIYHLQVNTFLFWGETTFHPYMVWATVKIQTSLSLSLANTLQVQYVLFRLSLSKPLQVHYVLTRLETVFQSVKIPVTWNLAVIQITILDWK